MNASVPENASGKLAKLAGLTVPIKLTGNLMSPSYSLDVESALRGAAEKRIQEEKSKLDDKVREKLKEREAKVDDETRDKIKQGLQSLFGKQKDKAPDSESPDSSSQPQ